MWGNLNLIARARKSWARLVSNCTHFSYKKFSVGLELVKLSEKSRALAFTLLLQYMVPLITSLSTAAASVKKQADAPVFVTFTPPPFPNMSRFCFGFFQIKGKKLRFCLPQNCRCEVADQSTTCMTLSCFSKFKESSSSPTKTIILAEKPQTWEVLWLTKATWVEAENKAAFSHRYQHAGLLSKHLRYYQKTQNTPGRPLPVVHVTPLSSGIVYPVLVTLVHKETSWSLLELVRTWDYENLFPFTITYIKL